MLNCGSLNKTKFKLNITLLLSIYLVLYISLHSFLESNESISKSTITHIVYRGDCECRKRESFKLYRTNERDVVLKVGGSYQEQINLKELNRTTCDLFSTLRRPRGQRVYSVNLYGKEGRYYQLFKCKKKKSN